MKIYAALILLIVFLTGQAGASDLPASYDLRNIDGKSYIGPVRDQGKCGSCWAFGTIAAAESTWNIANQQRDQNAIDLSESFLAWSLSPLYDGMSGCDGGDLIDPAIAMIEYGTPKESDFPYPIEEDGTVKPPEDGLYWEIPRVRMKDAYSIPLNDIETTRRVINSVGAVAVAAYSGRDEWFNYEEGIFEDELCTAASDDLAKMDHAIALVGWNDKPEDGGGGYWIMRNSWGNQWGEDGYMRIRYTSSLINTLGSYLIAQPWENQSLQVINNYYLQAEAWSAGGTVNAHGVDLWGADASSLDNRAPIRADVSSSDEMATARGVYLWGGPRGNVTNQNLIEAFAQSQDAQAFAYGICLQGGRVENYGRITAEASSSSDMAVSYGIWAANGQNSLSIKNTGNINSKGGEGNLNTAAGIWSEHTGLTRITNTGSVSAQAGQSAGAIIFNSGPGRLENSGSIFAQTSGKESLLQLKGGWGVVGRNETEIKNNGTIGGSAGSVLTYGNTLLNLDTGSDLIGEVELKGRNDTVLLTGTGSENETFSGAENLISRGHWSLSGKSVFKNIEISRGIFYADGQLTGHTIVSENAVLSGNGSLTGTVRNAGIIYPQSNGGHLTVNGNFTQQSSGVLAIGISKNQTGSLLINGKADLGGTLTITPAGYTSGGDFTFLRSHGITGSFEDIKSVAVLNTSLYTKSSGNLAVEVTRNSYTSLAASHNRSLAASLDTARPEAADQFGELLDTLDMAGDTKALNTAMTSLTPRIHGLGGAVVLDDSQARIYVLGRRLTTGSSAGTLELNHDRKTKLWAHAPAADNRYHSSGAYFRAEEKRYGLMLGAERQCFGNITLGIAGSVTQSDYESQSTQDKGENMSWQGYVYAGWADQQKNGGLKISGALGAGQTELEAERDIALSPGMAKSSHDGTIISAALQGGYEIRAGKWTLTPALGLGYVQLKEDGFCESKAGLAGLQISSRKDHSLQSFAGGSVERQFCLMGMIIKPELRLRWQHEFDHDSKAIKARLAGGGDYFKTPGRDLSSDSLVAGLSVKTSISESAFCSLDYDLNLQNSNGYTGHVLGLQAGIMF